MSYILDALRRAEAERERGAVPGLNAQPFNPASAKRRASLQRRRRLILGIGLLLLIAIAIGVYAALHSAAETPLPMAAVVSQAPVAEPVVPAPSPAAAASVAATPTPSPAIVAATPTPSPAIVAPMATAPAASARTSRSVTPAPAVQASRARPSYIDAPPPEPKPVVRKAPAVAGDASAPATEARIYKLAELPANIRAELPKLTLGGSMYSDNPAARMVIVNGQVLHEHDPITSDLSLDQITLKAAVFAYKGYKYEMPF